MPSFDKKPKPPSPFSDFAEPNKVDTQVFTSLDDRFDSPRKIGKRTIQVICPDCGRAIEVEVATYDMKTGQKTFLKEME